MSARYNELKRRLELRLAEAEEDLEIINEHGLHPDKELSYNFSDVARLNGQIDILSIMLERDCQASEEMFSN